MKKTIVLLLFVGLSSFLKANIVNDTIKMTGDSIHYLTLKDTVFLSIGAYQEKVFYHYIAKKQTLYSIAKFYGLSVEELYYYNPILKDSSISPGLGIKIPIPNKSIIRYKNEEFDDNTHIPICYRVKRGDTMYNLSKRIFQMPIDTLMVRNNLESFTLSMDQVLILGWMSIEGIPEANRKIRGHPIWKKNEALHRRYIQNASVKKEHMQRGVAYWQKESKQDSELYALHRTAPINSVVAITNPMKKRTVYAKVIGRMPETVYGDNIVVVVSGSGAKMLGAIDSKFYVQVRYTK